MRFTQLHRVKRSLDSMQSKYEIVWTTRTGKTFVCYVKSADHLVREVTNLQKTYTHEPNRGMQAPVTRGHFTVRDWR